MGTVINQSNQIYFPAIITHVTYVYLHDSILSLKIRNTLNFLSDY